MDRNEERFYSDIRKATDAIMAKLEAEPHPYEKCPQCGKLTNKANVAKLGQCIPCYRG